MPPPANAPASKTKATRNNKIPTAWVELAPIVSPQEMNFFAERPGEAAAARVSFNDGVEGPTTRLLQLPSR
jgi:hypothetical protein